MVAEIIASGVVGGLLGLLILAAFDPRSQASDMDVYAIIGGILVGIGLNRVLRG